MSTPRIYCLPAEVFLDIIDATYEPPDKLEDGNSGSSRKRLGQSANRASSIYYMTYSLCATCRRLYATIPPPRWDKVHNGCLRLTEAGEVSEHLSKLARVAHVKNLLRMERWSRNYVPKPDFLRNLGINVICQDVKDYVDPPKQAVRENRYQDGPERHPVYTCTKCLLLLPMHAFPFEELVDMGDEEQLPYRGLGLLVNSNEWVRRARARDRAALRCCIRCVVDERYWGQANEPWIKEEVKGFDIFDLPRDMGQRLWYERKNRAGFML